MVGVIITNKMDGAFIFEWNEIPATGIQSNGSILVALPLHFTHDPIGVNYITKPLDDNRC